MLTNSTFLSTHLTEKATLSLNEYKYSIIHENTTLFNFRKKITNLKYSRNTHITTKSPTKLAFKRPNNSLAYFGRKFWTDAMLKKFLYFATTEGAFDATRLTTLSSAITNYVETRRYGISNKYRNIPTVSNFFYKSLKKNYIKFTKIFLFNFINRSLVKNSHTTYYKKIKVERVLESSLFYFSKILLNNELFTNFQSIKAFENNYIISNSEASPIKNISRLHKTMLYSALYSNFYNYVFKLAASTSSDYFKFNNFVTTTHINNTLKFSNVSGKSSIEHFGSVEFFKTFGYHMMKSAYRRLLTIRFTPGYLPFFRKLRQDFMVSHGKTFPYQKRLTKYLTKYNHLNNTVLLKMAALNLQTTLASAILSYNESAAGLLIDSGSVFLNGRLCKKRQLQLQKYDLIQLKLNYNIYINVMWSLVRRFQLMQQAFNFINKFKELLKTKYEFAPHRSNFDVTGYFKTFKLNRLLNIYLAYRDVPNYLELDYFTLSYVIIYEPTQVEDFNYVQIRRTAVGHIRMLNWKYIN